MYKCIILDLDGTLLDSDNVVIKTWKELIKTYKNSDYKISDNELRKFSGPPLAETIPYIFPEYDYKEMLNNYCERTKKYYDSDLKIFYHAIKVIRTLKKEEYILGVITQKNYERSSYSLKKFKILNSFDFLISGDTIKYPKPNPYSINVIKEKYHLKNEEILYVGDNYLDYLFAKNANVDNILMTMLPRKYEDTPHPICFLNSYDELYKEIKNHDNK